MIDKKDIRERIESDFGNKSSEVMKIFKEVTSQTTYLNDDRIIRCIIFLAEKNIEKLKKYIEAAIIDPRDIMLWAEYIHQDANKTSKRVRDFSKTFDQSELDIR